MAIGLEYHHSCVNCRGPNTDLRNEKGLPCQKCLPDPDLDPFEYLSKTGGLMELGKIRSFKEEYENFEKFFESKLRHRPTGFQRLWMRRLLLKKSFSAIAPTGMGKTTFGIISAMWYESNGMRSLLIFPTTILVESVFQRISDMGSSGVIRYHSRMNRSEREHAVEKIESGDFSIAVVSSQFLSRNFEKLRKNKYDFIFVDDVDSVLKSSKNVDRLLILLGIPEDVVKLALRKIMKRSNDPIPEVEHGILVVSSATVKPRGMRHLLFRELLDFDVGSLVVGSRNVVNIRLKPKSPEKLMELLGILKDGVIILARNYDEVENLKPQIEETGIRVESVSAGYEVIEAFKRGEINVLLGVASHYGKLVRGVDLPERVKFVIFYGAPVFVYRADFSGCPRFVLKRVLKELAREDPGLKKAISMLEKGFDLDRVRESIDISEDTWNEAVRKVYGKYLSEDGKSITIPDALTYVQGSGRASRFTRWGLTKGLSILLEDDDRVFENLRERLEWLVEEEWIEDGGIDWNALLREVDNSRKTKGEPVDFESVLFIVESPTKAGTISGFFGRSGLRRYEGLTVHESVFNGSIILFTASRGHVYDLVSNEGVHGIKVRDNTFIPVYNTIKRCRTCGHQFTEDLERCPKCGGMDLDDKTKLLSGLRQLAMEVDRIVVATDPDTEGEKIAHDVSQHLIPVNPRMERVELHEITRSEFTKRFLQPRLVDQNMVKAQVVRRVQDRWIGFELSQIVQRRFNRSNLSAGRVQSTVLGWIVKRQREHEDSLKEFTKVFFKGRSLDVEGHIEPKRVRVLKIRETIEKISPPPPHTTDTVLSSATKVLRKSVSDVMNILQDLFEMGYITYHRTGSRRISAVGQRLAEKLFKKLGLDIFQGRSWESEGAHEAIRPTKTILPEDLAEMLAENVVENLSDLHVRVYELIFKRFLMSQSKPIRVKKQKVKLDLDGTAFEDEVICSILEDGWNLLENIETFRYEYSEYPVEKIRHYEKHTIPLFTQSTLIEEMRNRGIGRPSTYAKILDTLFKRKYAFEDRYHRIRPTPLGEMVYSFLERNFERFVTDETTRKLEEMMDAVEEGSEDYENALRKLWRDLESIRSHRLDHHLHGHND